MRCDVNQLKIELEAINTRINKSNKRSVGMRKEEEKTLYLNNLIKELENLDELLMLSLTRDIQKDESTYVFLPKDAVIDLFISYNSFDKQTVIVAPPNTTIYPLLFPYSGARGPRGEIEKMVRDYLGNKGTVLLPFILGNEPLEISQGEFEPISILKPSVGFDGRGALIGIIDTGIDYTHPAFIDPNGETRISAIWDQTIGTDSPYGYGTVYEKEIINIALKSPNPFEIVPHKDEWGHGTILAGIAAGYYKDDKGDYKGIAPGAEMIIVKLKSASVAMQRVFHGRYNPLGFSGLDIALAVEFLASFANQMKKPISICLPSGTNSGSHDGTNVLDSIIHSYSSNPGVCTVLAVGEEANKSHHASGDLKENEEQKVSLRISEGQKGFVVEIWAKFGDRMEVFLTPPRIGSDILGSILLNNLETHKISETSFVWSAGSEFDVDTGCQVIRFRFEDPIVGEWFIGVKGVTVIDGIYNIWIPKAGMILPGTVLSPASPFVTVYNTSVARGIIAIGCYDKKALSACPSSGRGFTRDRRVSPDYIADGINIPGPLPGNKWGSISGTAPSSAITVGITSIIYESVLVQEKDLPNTVVMKAILSDYVKREPTLVYPNPSSGYGVIDINAQWP